MNDLATKIEKNKGIIILCLSVLMFIFFAFCPAFDILGKAKASGFELVFDGKGAGFSRILSALMLIVPIVAIVGQFTSLKLKVNFDTICFLSAFILGFILTVALPSGISFAWGAWCYMILALLGLAVCNVHLFIKK